MFPKHLSQIGETSKGEGTEGVFSNGQRSSRIGKPPKISTFMVGIKNFQGGKMSGKKNPKEGARRKVIDHTKPREVIHCWGMLTGKPQKNTGAGQPSPRLKASSHAGGMDIGTREGLGCVGDPIIGASVKQSQKGRGGNSKKA